MPAAPADAAPPSAADSPRDREAMALQRRWVHQLDLAEKDRRDFVADGRKVVDRYAKSAKVGAKARRRGTPILYANTEQLRSALYGRPAKPDVRRRFSDRDPVGQAAAEMIERALVYFGDRGDGDQAVAAAVQDLCLPGLGVVRVEYEPIIDRRQATDPVTGQPLFEVDEDGEPTDEPAMVEFLADQRVHRRYVFWPDFACSPARSWSGVSWVAFRHVMGVEAVESEVYGTAGERSQTYGAPERVPYDWMPEGQDRERGPVDPETRKAEVWEVWDKPSATRLWIVKGAAWPLRVDEDPYELDGFWPCPEPMTAYGTNDSVVPTALFRAYEEEADDLDEITRRIAVLTKALKRRGVYDQSIPELKRLANANDNEYVPSPNYAALQTKGGLAASMQSEDISVTAGVILQLMKQRDAQVQAIYEISGISDIMRGSTDPDETLGAQQLKAQTGSMRLKRMQAGVQRFARDLLRIEVDLLCRHFDAGVLQQITNMRATPEIMAVLQSDAMRGYRVDIETDSTVFADAAQMQASRAQLLQGVTQLITAMAPIVGQKPQLAPLMFKMLEFGVAPAQDARMLEDAFDEAQQALMQAAQAGPGQNPAAMMQQQTEQAKLQAAQAKASAEAQKGQTAVAVAQIQQQGVAAKAQADVQRTALQVQQQREAHAQSLAQSQAQHQQDMAHAAQAHAMDMAQASLAGAQRAAPGAPAQPPAAPPMLRGAVRAPDGQHYVRLPHAGGQFHRVSANA